MQELPSRKPLAERAFRNGGRLILDFGEELVGRLQLTLRSETNYNDSPVRLRLVFAEFPLEIADRNRKGSFSLSSAWIQDEIVTLDDMPQTYTLPRIYAMRYVYIEVMATPNRLVFEEICFLAQSAVRNLLPPLPGFSPEEAELDRVAQRGDLADKELHSAGDAHIHHAPLDGALAVEPDDPDGAPDLDIAQCVHVYLLLTP